MIVSMASRCANGKSNCITCKEGDEGSAFKLSVGKSN